MANHKSAVKRARQNDTRRTRNTALRSKMKTEVTAALKLIETAKSKDEAKKAITSASRALQKAASKGVIPKERASRKLGRVADRANAKFA